MNCSPTLSAEEFKVLHNTLWELSNIDNPKVAELVERIRSQALAGAYEQDNRAFERKHDIYRKVQKHWGFKTIWSLYEVEDLEAQHPFAGAAQVAYVDHWGDEPVFVEIKTEGAGSGTWIDLWRAADEAIQRSGDQHHVFIEQFRPNPKNPQQLLLSTGS